jgi:hypothetical protein
VAVHGPCLSDLAYCDIHDAYFCPVCDVWNESPCSDRDCEFCPTRAERPSLCVHSEKHHWQTD